MIGSASGVQQGYQRTVPTSSVVRQWTQKDFSADTQALLQNGNVDLPLTLAAGATSVRGDAEYVAGYGAEYVYETSPLNSPADIDHVLSTAVVAETSEGYDVVIGENPNGDGHIALYILGSTIIGATSVETVGDTIEREKEEDTDQDGSDKIGEDDIDDAPGQEEWWRLSDRQKLWIRTVGDFVLNLYKASNIYDQYSDDDDENDSQCGLNATDINMAVDEQVTGRFSSSSTYTLFSGEYQKTKNNVATDYYCVHDRDAFVQTYADNPTDLTDGSAGERVSVELMEERGYEIVWPEGGFDEGDASEIGPDVIAYDENTGEYVIVEAKTTGSTDAVGISLFRTDAYDGDPQLSEEWIENSIERLESQGQLDSSTVDEVILALDNGNIRQEVVFVRDVEASSTRTLANPRSASSDISNKSVIGVDAVTVIDLKAEDDSND